MLDLEEACLETEFACAKSGLKGLQKCLSPDVVCDGVRDCPKGDDEEGCVKCEHGSKVVFNALLRIVFYLVV